MLRRLPNTPPRYITLTIIETGECKAVSGQAEYLRTGSEYEVDAWLHYWGYFEVATNLYERETSNAQHAA